MSQVSQDIIKYKTIQALTNAAIYVAVYMTLKYVLKTLESGIEVWPSSLMLFTVWFIIDYAMHSAAAEYYVLPEFESQVREIVESQGMQLKSQEEHRWLYHKPRSLGRNDFVVITRKETYFTVKGSTDFSPKLEPLISDDMLYGKWKRLIFSRPNQLK